MLVVFFQPVPEYQPVLSSQVVVCCKSRKREKLASRKLLNFCEHKAVSIATSGLFKDVFSNCAE